MEGNGRSVSWRGVLEFAWWGLSKTMTNISRYCRLTAWDSKEGTARIEVEFVPQ